MDKKDAVKIIEDCAWLYNDNLLSNHLMFLYNENDSIKSLEAEFSKSRYLHLTGVVVDGSLSANVFFDRCVHNTLSLEDFEFRTNGTTELKLYALPQLMKIHKTCKMLGNYNYSDYVLSTEKILGNVHACLGLVKAAETKNIYVPNTSLKADIRDITTEAHRVVAVLRKSFDEKHYCEVTYTAKGIDIKSLNLSAEILNKMKLS